MTTDRLLLADRPSKQAGTAEPSPGISGFLFTHTSPSFTEIENLRPCALEAFVIRLDVPMAGYPDYYLTCTVPH